MTYEMLKRDAMFLFRTEEHDSDGRYVGDRNYWLMNGRVYMRETRFVSKVDKLDKLRSALSGYGASTNEELLAVEKRLLRGDFTTSPEFPPMLEYGDSLIMHGPFGNFLLPLTGLEELSDEAIWNRFAEAECRRRGAGVPMRYDFGKIVKLGISGCYQHLTLSIFDAYLGTVCEQSRVHLEISAGRRIKGDTPGYLKSEDDITSFGFEVAATDIFGRKTMLFSRATNTMKKTPQH